MSTPSFDVCGWLEFANYDPTAPGVPLYRHAVEVTPDLVKACVNRKSGHDACRVPTPLTGYYGVAQVDVWLPLDPLG